MDWTKGISASYYMSIVDSATWRDIQRIEITGGSIKRQSTGLMESADVDCVRYQQGTERWIRVWLDATQSGGGSSHEPLFTGLACAPDRDIDGVLETNRVQCYSVLKPANDVLLPRGWYAPAGVPGDQIIRELLEVTPAPVQVDGIAPALASHVVAEDGETRLSMAQKILTAINWRMRLDGYGTITLQPVTGEPVETLGALDNDVIETKLKVSADWYDCPNVFRAIDGNVTGIARDDDPNSPLSTVRRGREVWAEDTSCDLADNETVEEYAIRMLRQLQKYEREVSYDRRYLPDLTVGDCVRLRYPAQDIEGRYRIESQSITIGYGARTAESVAYIGG